MTEYYDVVDSDGNVVETAADQEAQTKAEIPLPLDPPTPGELKKLRKMYVTRQHPKVIACQHRLDLSRQPVHRNCEACWFAWFNENGKVVQQLDEMYTAEKVDEIIILQGIKFYKMWRKFMSTIAQWKETMEQGE